MNVKIFIGKTTEYEKKVVLETKKPKSWCKTISAFANVKGGKLILVLMIMIISLVSRI